MNYSYCKTWEVPNFDKSRPIMADTETSTEPFNESFGGYTRLFQIAQDGVCYIFDCFYVNVELIKLYLSDAHLVFHNAHYDLSCLNLQRWQPIKFDDTMHMARHILPHLDSFSFKSVGKYFKVSKGEEGSSNWNGSLTESQLQYAANDVLDLETIYYGLKSISDPEEFFTYRLDIKSISYALIYQLNGLPINNSNRKKRIRESRKMITEIEKQLPEGLNINSSKQVCEFLGSESSSRETLEALSMSGDSRARLIVDSRIHTKRIQFLEEKFNAQRVYGFFKPSGAKTGRWSCSAMPGANVNSQNLQQLPKTLKDVYGYEDSDPRWLVDIDYTGLEVFTIMGTFGEEKMADILRSGDDFHTSVAMMMWPGEEITKHKRTLAKVCTFGLSYGAGPGVLQKLLTEMAGVEVELDEAKTLRDLWLTTFPEIKKAHAKAGEAMNGKDSFAIVVSPTGRPIRANSYTEYLASPCQSLGADCMKIALHLLYQKQPGIRVCNTVHDSLNVECMSFEEAEETAKLVKWAFDESWKLILPSLGVENVFMDNQADIIKTLDQGR